MEVFYLEQPTPDYIKSSVDSVFAIHAAEPKGDILVFLTGQEEASSIGTYIIQCFLPLFDLVVV